MIAFIGGAQIDPYGNVNSTCIFGKGDYVNLPHVSPVLACKRNRYLLQHHHHDAASEEKIHGAC